MNKRNIFTAVLLSAAVLAFYGCDKKTPDTSVSDTGSNNSSITQSDSSTPADQKIQNEKPPVLKKGTIVHMEKHYADDNNTLMHEEKYNDDGKILKYFDNTFSFEKDITYEYDANGNLVKETKDWFNDCNYRTVTEYDEKGLESKKTETYRDNGRPVYDHTYSYEFDGSGNPVVCNDESGKKVWERVYENGKVKKQSDFTTSTMGMYLSSETEFDADGNKVMFTKYDNNGTVTRQTGYNVHGDITSDHGFIYSSDIESDIVNEYDSNGFLIKATTKEGNDEFSSVYENDPEGNPVHETKYHNGEVSEEKNHTYEYNYDENGNVIKMTELSSGEAFFYTTYEYVYKD